MIISSALRSNFKTRVAYAFIFFLLIIGSVTMIYPLLLMLAGSVKSDADSMYITPYPEFWFNDSVLFHKYAESKYNVLVGNCRSAWNINIPSWRRIENPTNKIDSQVIADFRAWRETPEAKTLSVLGHVSGGGLLPINARLWRRIMEHKCNGVLSKYCSISGTIVTDWAGVMPPAEIIGRYRYQFPNEGIKAEYKKFKDSRPAQDLYFMTSDAMFVENIKSKLSETLELANKLAGTSYSSWSEVHVKPVNDEDAANKMMQEFRIDFLRNTAPLQYVRIDNSPEAVSAYHRTLVERHTVIRSYNKMHGTNYDSFESIPLPRRIDDDPSQRIEWEEFIKNSDACKQEWLELYGPEELFLEFRAGKCGRSPEDVAKTPAFSAIAATVDYDDCMASKFELRKEFTFRNYIQVIEYIGRHGNGIINTLIYCLLAVTTSIIVTPLAAYALSRFNLPGTYQILLFCMATMAFPGEVSMIPSFILLKRFPLWPLVGACAAMVITYILLVKFFLKMKENYRLLISAAAGLFVGAVALPAALGPERTTVSLLNTFAALILPGVASGYFTFLLKGFFDSMPKELYEAAELDGASEWTKFWSLTISLSKPILAVIALGAFTGAYSAFMMALVIIPDQSMWTIMVWIFQLQSLAHGAVGYAALVIAAIPTFLVFVFCQNMIIRGIVVPTEK